jgi:formylglycine-generating enzyme required for sulfatase activity
MPLAQGEILNNRYRIVKLLGQGGFGAVYRAWDTNLEVPVAIKENLDISPAAQKQFKREAQLLFNLRHPNLPRVHDHFVSPGQGQYLVMDFVVGQDLGEMLSDGPLPEAKVLPWIIQVCDALSYLHSQAPPVIHRDIKPGNIKITPEGKAMLVDFGISKIYDPNLATTVGARAVTPGYSPPEQYGKGATDIRSDLYALGATLYHLLTGQLPSDSVDILTRNAPPPPPVVDLNPSISEAIGAAITKAMALDREARWANAEEFKQAITTKPSFTSRSNAPAIPATQVTTSPPPSQVIPHQARAPISKRKTPCIWFGAFGAIMIIIAFLIWIGNPFHSPVPSTPVPNFTDEHGVEMKFIPAGEFEMGSESGDSDERPVHTVYLNAFYIDVYEVTNALYAACVEAGACIEPSIRKSYSRDSYYGDSTYDDYPVINVIWDQANDFCEWRGARLPTEAEWEKAARGGLEEKLYPWGDEKLKCRKGAYNGAKFDTLIFCNNTDTDPVGSYSANGYGLYDMAGNVLEWVMDWYSENYYASSPAENPTGPSSGSYRSSRGGSWLEGGGSLRAPSRHWSNPSVADGFTGFRCARSH